jgi:hypothetical protein
MLRVPGKRQAGKIGQVESKVTAATAICDLKRNYAGEWLAIKVTKRGKYHEPVAGKLICHAKTHKVLHHRLRDPNVYETYSGKLPTKAILLY